MALLRKGGDLMLGMLGFDDQVLLFVYLLVIFSDEMELGH
jgi:hypothetical protein